MISAIHDGLLRTKTLYHYVMEKKLRIPPFRERVDVTFVLKIDPSVRRRLTKFHRDCYSWFCEHARELASMMEPALARYYRTWRKNWGDEARHYFGNERAKQMLPVLKGDAGIWRLAKPVSLEILAQDDPLGYDARIDFSATWDEEHGVAVRFRNGKIIDVTAGSAF